MNKMVVENESVRSTFNIDEDVHIQQLIQTFVDFAMAMTFTEPQIIKALQVYLAERESSANWYSKIWSEIGEEYEDGRV